MATDTFNRHTVPSLVSDDNWETITIKRRTDLEKLLHLAKCPNEDCDGDGTCAKYGPGYDGEGDIDVWQCQWCHERAEVLALGGYQTKVGDTWYQPNIGIL